MANISLGRGGASRSSSSTYAEVLAGLILCGSCAWAGCLGRLRVHLCKSPDVMPCEFCLTGCIHTLSRVTFLSCR